MKKAAVHLKRLKRPEDFRPWLEALPVDIPLGRPVVLKPNLVYPADWRSGMVSDVRMARQLIEWLRAKGVKSISMAEGPGLGVDAGLAFEKTGFAALSRETGVPLVDLNRAERRPVDWPGGKIMLPAVLGDAFYINLPKVKTHLNTLVTLGLKNQKGLLSPEDKKRFHKTGLHRPVAELLKAVRPDLTILDGFLALEGDGPLAGGRRVRLGVVAAGTDALAVDATGCRLMGIDPLEVEHLRLAHEMGLGSLDLEVMGDRLEDCARRFKRPEMGTLRIMNLHNQRTALACSLCGGSAREALFSSARNPAAWPKKLLPVLWRMIFGRIDFVYGHRALVPRGAGTVVAVGDCTRHLKDEPGVVWVEGCPPSPEMMVEAFAGINKR
jgi:uncharacterized protein (DUF362 family)